MATSARLIHIQLELGLPQELRFNELPPPRRGRVGVGGALEGQPYLHRPLVLLNSTCVQERHARHVFSHLSPPPCPPPPGGRDSPKATALPGGGGGSTTTRRGGSEEDSNAFPTRSVRATPSGPWPDLLPRQREGRLPDYECAASCPHADVGQPPARRARTA